MKEIASYQLKRTQSEVVISKYRVQQVHIAEDHIRESAEEIESATHTLAQPNNDKTDVLVPRKSSPKSKKKALKYLVESRKSLSLRKTE